MKGIYLGTDFVSAATSPFRYIFCYSLQLPQRYVRCGQTPRWGSSKALGTLSQRLVLGSSMVKHGSERQDPCLCVTLALARRVCLHRRFSQAALGARRSPLWCGAHKEQPAPPAWARRLPGLEEATQCVQEAPRTLPRADTKVITRADSGASRCPSLGVCAGRFQAEGWCCCSSSSLLSLLPFDGLLCETAQVRLSKLLPLSPCWHRVS